MTINYSIVACTIRKTTIIIIWLKDNRRETQICLRTASHCNTAVGARVVHVGYTMAGICNERHESTEYNEIGSNHNSLPSDTRGVNKEIHKRRNHDGGIPETKR